MAKPGVNLLKRSPGRRPRVALALAFCAAVIAGIMAAGAPALAETRVNIPGHQIVVSIPPLASLVAAVMEGTGTPYILVRGAASPHDTSLRPSDARALTRAEVVIWAGPALESFLVKALDALVRDARVVTLTGESSLRRLPLAGAGTGTGAGAIDPHLWLDPVNAGRMVAIFAVVLAEADPDNGAVYRANAVHLAERLDSLDAELRRRLAPVRSVPHMVFHDAFAYFQARYGLNQVGVIAINPETRPGARHLLALRRRIREEGVACVFIEPQFNPALVDAMTEGTGARVATLDPLGARETYFTMMRNLTDALVDCLEGS